MLTRLRIQGFKSWQDTGDICMAPITGFFGTNSSGKTALIQAPLLLKQTAESADRFRALHAGDEKTYVDLGTFRDFAHAHQLPTTVHFEIDWTLNPPLQISDPAASDRSLFSIRQLSFQTAVTGDGEKSWVRDFSYRFSQEGKECLFGMEADERGNAQLATTYQLRAFNSYDAEYMQGRSSPLLNPVRFYGFPPQVFADYPTLGFLTDLVLSLEQMLQRIYYPGPLRVSPQRSYVWAGEKPDSVGRQGELAVPALLATRQQQENVRRISRGAVVPVERRIAEWLQELQLIYDFELHPVAANHTGYEVRVRRSKDAAKVLITDVGFGVSQILPVLVLCYYAPEGSTLIFEHPEIHLHPAVQAGLADVFIDAATTRNIQIIVESHSEHLLRRLQRRVAEEKVGADQVALYFTEFMGKESELHRLEMDVYGFIRNWPENFFGDDLGEAAAMTEAAMKRRMTHQNGMNT